MVKIYHGTTQEYYEKQTGRWKVYTHKQGLIERIFLWARGRSVEPEIQFANARYALSFAGIRADEFGLTPLLIMADTEILSRQGIPFRKMVGDVWKVYASLPRISHSLIRLDRGEITDLEFLFYNNPDRLLKMLSVREE